jgi:hypothetical protein
MAGQTEATLVGPAMTVEEAEVGPAGEAVERGHEQRPSRKARKAGTYGNAGRPAAVADSTTRPSGHATSTTAAHARRPSRGYATSAPATRPRVRGPPMTWTRRRSRAWTRVASATGPATPRSRLLPSGVTPRPASTWNMTPPAVIAQNGVMEHGEGDGERTARPGCGDMARRSVRPRHRTRGPGTSGEASSSQGERDGAA